MLRRRNSHNRAEEKELEGATVSCSASTAASFPADRLVVSTSSAQHADVPSPTASPGSASASPGSTSSPPNSLTFRSNHLLLSTGQPVAELTSPHKLSRLTTVETLLSPSTGSSSLSTLSGSPAPAFSVSLSTVRSLLAQILRMGSPSAATCLIQNLIQVSSTLFLGHISTEALAASAISNMICNLTGFSVGLGFTTCLDALCSQAYGGRRYHLVGLHAQKGLVIMTLACLPVAVVWSQTAAVVRLMGLEEYAALAQLWAHWLMLGMWPFFMFEVMRRWLQAQRVVWPVVVAAATTIVWNLSANYVLIYRYEQGFQAPAVVMAASYWVMLAVMLLCAWGRQRWIMWQLRQRRTADGQLAADEVEMVRTEDSEGVEDDQSAGVEERMEEGEEEHREEEEEATDAGDQAEGGTAPRSVRTRVARWTKRLRAPSQYDPLTNLPLDSSLPSPTSTTGVSAASPAVVYSYHDCWPPLSWSIFSHWGEHFRLGLPGALSLLFEWGSYEVSASLAGRLGAVPLAAHSILMSTAALCYSWPLGLSNATAAIIGNQLGAGEARLAAVTAALALALCTTWGLTIGGLFMFVLRPWWGDVFTDDPAVRDAVQATVWVLWFYFSFDSMKCALMAVLRGCGRPMITVYGNVLSCWCVQYPIAFTLLARSQLSLVTLWGCMTSAWLTATVVYCAVLIRTDWKDECRKAAERNDREGSSGAAAGGEDEEQQLQLQELHSDTMTENITHVFDSDKTETDSEDGEEEEEINNEEEQPSSEDVMVTKVKKAKALQQQQRMKTPDTAPSA